RLIVAHRRPCLRCGEVIRRVHSAASRVTASARVQANVGVWMAQRTGANLEQPAVQPATWNRAPAPDVLATIVLARRRRERGRGSARLAAAHRAPVRALPPAPPWPARAQR